MATNIIWRNPRPTLTVEPAGSRQLGRCYYESTYRVMSTSPLGPEVVEALRKARLVGIGQEFSAHQVLADGRKVAVRDVQDPSGEDEVEAIEVDEGGKPTGRPAVNPYSGNPYPLHKFSFYVYECVTRCDSGD
ncbi:MAG: hypothetical protein EBT03_12640 [Betaproteobacteria bacterium]|nr:hypothetical protein [Betaproteobacteria bacterium]NCA17653.1 hypothetical protein [Betaproteobacteria bacterium]